MSNPNSDGLDASNCPIPYCKNPRHTFGYCMVHKVYADMEEEAHQPKQPAPDNFKKVQALVKAGKISDHAASLHAAFGTAPHPSIDTDVTIKPAAVEGVDELEDRIDTILGSNIGDELLRDPKYDTAVKQLVQVIQSREQRVIKSLLENKHVYNIKSIDGELVDFNTGVMAVPAAAIEKYLTEGEAALSPKAEQEQS